MPFPIFAAIGAAVGIGGAIINGAGQRAAADAQNRAQDEAARKQHEYDKAVYKWQNDSAMAQWSYDMARTAQLRELENQYSLEQAQQGTKLIQSAIQNYDLNMGALYDEFVVGETIRATQEGLQYGRTMQQAGQAVSEAGIQYGMTLSRSGFEVQQTILDASQRKAAVMLDTMEQTRQYMTSVLDAGLQAQQLMARTQNEAKSLVESLTIEEARDYLGYQLNQAVAIAEDSKAKARGYAMQGGGGTAQRLAVEAAQQLGRRYGELTLASRSREAKLGALNGALKGEVASQMGQLALRMQDSADRTAYAISRADLDAQSLDQNVSLSVNRSQAETSFARSMYDLSISRASSEADFASNIMKSVTIPSFELSSRQYQREVTALGAQTQGVIDEALIPYRQAIYFDPLKPIPGPEPVLIGPTPVQAPSWGSIIGNSVIQGFKGAMQFSSVQNGKVSFY